MSGRRAGYCAGYDRPGYVNPGYVNPGYANPGFANQPPEYRPRFGGRAGGWGAGRGWRHWFRGARFLGWTPFDAVPPTPEQEVDGLKSMAETLKSELDAINQRIEALDKKE